MRNIVELANDLVAANNEYENTAFIKNNNELLKEYVAFYCEICNQTEAVISKIYNQFIIEQNLLNSLPKIDFKNEIGFDLFLVQKTLNDKSKYKEFLNEGLNYLIDYINNEFYKSIGAEHDLFHIDANKKQFLDINAEYSIITLTCDKTTAKISYKEALEYFKEHKSAKGLINNYAPELWQRYNAILAENKRIFEYFSSQKDLVDFTQFTDNEKILKFASDLYNLYEARSNISLNNPFLTEEFLLLCENLFGDYVNTINRAVGSYIIKQPIYNVADFYENIRALG